MLFATNLLTAPARAQAPAVVTVNVFPGGFNWPSFVGQQKGFFERNGITVMLQATPNSVAQMTGLAEGKFDIAITAFDNIVAYVEGSRRSPHRGSTRVLRVHGQRQRVFEPRRRS